MNLDYCFRPLRGFECHLRWFVKCRSGDVQHLARPLHPRAEPEPRTAGTGVTPRDYLPTELDISEPRARKG